MKPSSIFRFILKAIAIVASVLIGIIGYIFIRPIIRAIGWIITIAVILPVIALLLGLF